MRLLLILVLVPLVEIALFVQLGRWMGLWPVLGMVIATAMVGFAVMARGRDRTAHELRQALAQERDPAAPLAHNALRMLGGVLLVMPGFLTDVIGMALLIPLLRAGVLRVLFTRVTASAQRHAGRRPARGEVIDGAYEVEHPPPGDAADPDTPPNPQSPWAKVPSRSGGKRH